MVLTSRCAWDNGCNSSSESGSSALSIGSVLLIVQVQIDLGIMDPHISILCTTSFSDGTFQHINKIPFCTVRECCTYINRINLGLSETAHLPLP